MSESAAISITRRRWLQGTALAATASLGGCLSPPAENKAVKLDHVWGQQGSGRGQLQKPRAIAIDSDDQLYLVDMTGRIQVFTADGEFLRGWRSPDTTNGKPSGLSFDQQGNLLVADTHYFQILVYTPDGRLLEERRLGGNNGQGPGEFNFVTDAVQDRQGNYYVAEYGQMDRIQKFDSQYRFLQQWGSHGTEPHQFIRPQNLALDEEGRVWVVDACNHQVKVFDARGEQAELVAMWGEPGEQPGQLRYPYDLVLTPDHVYLCEFGNHRVQKFTREGEWITAWGGPGTEPGQLSQPWALALDSRQRLHVVDSYNHRVQRILM